MAQSSSRIGQSMSTTAAGGGGNLEQQAPDMLHLLEEFKRLYESRLKRLDEARVANEEERLQMRIRIMQSYIEDMGDQNEVLVQTVEELEREANNRVEALEKKLQRTSQSTQDYMQQARNFEQEARQLANDKTKAQSDRQNTDEKAARLELQNSTLRQENADIRNDLNVLINVIATARTTGRWEIDDLRFRDITFDQVFGTWDEISKTRASEEILEDHVVELKKELDRRMELVERLQKELYEAKNQHVSTLDQVAIRDEALGSVTSELSSVHNRELAAVTEIQDKDLALMKLKTNLRTQQQVAGDLKVELDAKEREVGSLKTRIKDQDTEIMLRNSEIENLNHTINILQEKQRESSLELARCNDLVRQLKSDVVLVQEESSQAKHDVNHYERRIQQLEKDLEESKIQRRKAHDEIGTLQATIREGTRSTQTHTDVLKTELARRDDTIQKLRMDVLKLQEKRDDVVAQLDKQNLSANKLEDRQKQKDEELQRSERRNRQLEEELESTRLRFEESKSEATRFQSQLARCEGELQSLHAQHADSLTQSSSTLVDQELQYLQARRTRVKNKIQKLSVTLDRVQTSSKDTQEALAVEVADRHDMIMKLKEDNKALENEQQEALSSAKHRGDVIKQLRDEVKDTANKLRDKENRLAQVEGELAEYQNRYLAQNSELDRLQANIMEQRNTASQQEMGLKDTLHAKEEAIDGLTGEISQLKERLAQTQSLVKNKEEQVEAIQGQRVELDSELSSRDDKLHQVEMQLMSAQEEIRRNKDEISRREITIKQLDSDLAIVRKQMKDAIEENGRLDSRLQAYAINAQSEQEALNGEVKRREETLQQLRLQSLQQQETTSHLEEEVAQANKTIEQLKMQKTDLSNQIQSRDDVIKSVEAKYEGCQNDLSAANANITRLGDQVQELNSELAAMHSHEQSLNSTLQGKEDNLAQIKSDQESLQRQCRELIDKIKQRDEILTKLGAELKTVRGRYQDKLNECQKLSDTLKRLQEALHQSQLDLNDVRLKLETECKEKDEKLRELQEDLVESQAQYTACYDEVMRHEEVIGRLKEENNTINTVGQHNGQRLQEVEEHAHQMELELSISQEKHRTCQQEVANRDSVILRLQTELDTLNQKYTGSIEEINIKDDEQSRLTSRIRELQGELKDWQRQVEEAEQKAALSAQTVSQLEHDNQITSQEVHNHLRTIEQLKADSLMARSANSEEARRYQQDLAMMKDELDHVKTELADFEDANNSYKDKVSDLEQELGMSKEMYNKAVEELTRQEDAISQQGSALSQNRQHIMEMENQIQQDRETIEKLQSSTNSYRQKSDQCMEQIAHLEEAIKGLQDKLAETSQRVADKDENIGKLKNDLKNVETQLDEKSQNVTNCEDIIGQLTEELSHTQQELSHQMNTLSQLEDNVKNLKNKLQEKQAEAAHYEEKARTSQTELLSYKDSHSRTDEEFSEKEDVIRTIDLENERLRDDLQRRTLQHSESSEQLNELKVELAGLKEQKNSSVKEVNRLEQSLQQLQLNLASSHQKHKTEVSKLAEQNRCLEKDLAMERQRCQNLENEVARREDVIKRCEQDNRAAKEEINLKVDEIENLENAIRDLKVQCSELQKQVRQTENVCGQLENELERVRSDLSEARAQYKDCAQELAHHEEKLVIMEQSLNSTQEQLTNRVTEVVRFEQSNRKLQTEVRTLRDRNKSYEEEIGEQKVNVEKLRKDLINVKEECHTAQQEVITFRQRSHKLEVELEGARNHEQMLNDQVEQQDTILTQLQSELRAERGRQQESTKQLQQCKKLITELQDELEVCQKQQKEYIAKSTMGEQEALSLIRGVSLCKRKCMQLRQSVDTVSTLLHPPAHLSVKDDFSLPEFIHSPRLQGQEELMKAYANRLADRIVFHAFLLLRKLPETEDGMVEVSKGVIDLQAKYLLEKALLGHAASALETFERNVLNQKPVIDEIQYDEDITDGIVDATAEKLCNQAEMEALEILVAGDTGKTCVKNLADRILLRSVLKTLNAYSDDGSSVSSTRHNYDGDAILSAGAKWMESLTFKVKEMEACFAAEHVALEDAAQQLDETFQQLVEVQQESTKKSFLLTKLTNHLDHIAMKRLRLEQDLLKLYKLSVNNSAGFTSRDLCSQTLPEEDFPQSVSVTEELIEAEANRLSMTVLLGEAIEQLEEANWNTNESHLSVDNVISEECDKDLAKDTMQPITSNPDCKDFTTMKPAKQQLLRSLRKSLSAVASSCHAVSQTFSMQGIPEPLQAVEKCFSEVASSLAKFEESLTSQSHDDNHISVDDVICLDEICLEAFSDAVNTMTSMAMMHPGRRATVHAEYSGAASLGTSQSAFPKPAPRYKTRHSIITGRTVDPVMENEKVWGSISLFEQDSHQITEQRSVHFAKPNHVKLSERITALEKDVEDYMEKLTLKEAENLELREMMKTLKVASSQSLSNLHDDETSQRHDSSCYPSNEGLQITILKHRFEHDALLSKYKEELDKLQEKMDKSEANLTNLGSSTIVVRLNAEFIEDLDKALDDEPKGVSTPEEKIRKLLEKLRGNESELKKSQSLARKHKQERESFQGTEQELAVLRTRFHSLGSTYNNEQRISQLQLIVKKKQEQLENAIVERSQLLANINKERDIERHLIHCLEQLLSVDNAFENLVLDGPPRDSELLNKLEVLAFYLEKKMDHSPASDNEVECAKRSHFLRLQAELRDAYAKLADAEKQIGSLQGTSADQQSLSDASYSSRGLSHQRQKLNAETALADDLKAEVSRLQKDLTAKNDELSLANAKVTELTRNVKKLSDHNDKLQNRVLELMDKGSQDNVRNIPSRGLEEALRAKDDLYIGTKNQVSQLEQELEQQGRITSILKDKIASLEFKTSATLDKPEQQSAMAALHNLLGDAKDRIAELESDNERLLELNDDKMNIDAKKEILRLEKLISCMQNHISRIQPSDKLSTVERQSQLGSLYTLLEDARNRIKELEFENQRLLELNDNEMNSGAKKEILRLEQDLIQQGQVTSFLEQKIARIDPDGRLSKSEEQSALSALHTRLEKAILQIKELEAENQRLLELNENGLTIDTKKEMLGMERELVQQRQVTSFLEEKIARMDPEGRLNVTEEHSALTTLHIRLEEAVSQVSKLEVEKQKLIKSNEEFRTRATKELSELRACYSQEMEKNNIYEQRIVETEKNLKTMTELHNKTLNKVNAENEDGANYGISISVDMDKIEKVYEQLEEKTVKVRALEDRLKVMSARESELQHEISELRAKVMDFERTFTETPTDSDVQELKSLLASERKQLKEERNKVRLLTDDVSSLKSDLGYGTDGDTSTIGQETNDHGLTYTDSQVARLQTCLKVKSNLLDEMLSRMKELEGENKELKSNLRTESKHASKLLNHRDSQTEHVPTSARESSRQDLDGIRLIDHVISDIRETGKRDLDENWLIEDGLREALIAKTKKLDEAYYTIQQLEIENTKVVDSLKQLLTGRKEGSPGFEEELFQQMSGGLQISLLEKSHRLQEAYADIQSLDLYNITVQQNLHKAGQSLQELKYEMKKLKSELEWEQQNGRKYQGDCLNLQNQILDRCVIVCPACCAKDDKNALLLLNKLKQELGIALNNVNNFSATSSPMKPTGEGPGLTSFDEALSRAMNCVNRSPANRSRYEAAGQIDYSDMKTTIDQLKESEFETRKLVRDMQQEGEKKDMQHGYTKSDMQSKYNRKCEEVVESNKKVALLEAELRDKDKSLTAAEEENELAAVNLRHEKAIVRDLQQELEALATDYKAVQENLDDSREGITALETAVKNERQMLEIENTNLRNAKMEIAQLTGRVETNKNQALHASMQPQRLKADLNVEKERSQSARDELCGVRLELHNEKQRLIDVTTQLSQAEQELLKEKRVKLRQMEELNRNQKLIEELKTQMLVYLTDAGKLKNFKVDQCSLEDKVVFQEKCIQELEYKLIMYKDKKRAVQEELVLCKEDSNKVIEEFRAELQELRDIRQRDCQDLVKLQADLLETNRELLRYQDLNEKLNATNWPASAYCKVHEFSTLITRLKEEIDTLKNRENDYLSKAARMEGEYEADLSIHATEVKSLQRKLELKSKDLDKLRAEMMCYKQKEDQQEELFKVKNQRVEKLEAEWQTEKKQASQLGEKLKERDTAIDSLRDEMDSLQQTIRSLKEELAEREGQLRVSKMNLQTAQKQSIHHSQEVSRYEETLSQLQGELEQSQDQYRNCHAQLMEQEKSNQELKVQLTTVQGNTKESMDQLSEKSRQLANLRQELSRSQEQSQVLAQEVAIHKDKMRRLRQELKKVQEINRASEEELRAYEERYRALLTEMSAAEDRSKLALQDVSHKEEEVMMMKIEVQSTHEKLRMKSEEVESILKDNDMMKQKYHSATEEITNLRVALDDARSNGDRLHRESELVVHNVNSWVEETKQANEKLGNKIREQSKAIVQLTAEKDHMSDQFEQINKVKSELEIELDQRRVESERYKALQNHSSQQQILLNQLRKRLEEHETEQDHEINNKIATIDDLHHRLRGNVEIVQQLNDQLTALQKENLRIRSEMEREMAQRQSLRLQLDSKEQLINSLKIQLDNRVPPDTSTIASPSVYRGRYADSLSDSAYMSSRSVRKTNRNPPEEVADPQSLDKSYWINRVGELSTQLQQSSEYWSGKVRDLSHQLDRSKPTSPPKSFSPSRPR